MNKYKLQINGIEKYARTFWGNNENEVLDEFSEDYIEKMTDDTSELHNHICGALIPAHQWGSNCDIIKEDFTILEIDANNNIIKSYTYQEVWDLLPKKKVFYKNDVSQLTRGNIDTCLEPIIDVETNKVICNTNFSNIMNMIHRDLYDDFIEGNSSEHYFEIPVYFLDKVDNQPAGALNKYFTG